MCNMILTWDVMQVKTMPKQACSQLRQNLVATKGFEQRWSSSHMWQRLMRDECHWHRQNINSIGGLNFRGENLIHELHTRVIVGQIFVLMRSTPYIFIMFILYFWPQVFTWTHTLVKRLLTSWGTCASERGKVVRQRHCGYMPQIHPRQCFLFGW